VSIVTVEFGRYKGMVSQRQVSIVTVEFCRYKLSIYIEKL